MFGGSVSVPNLISAGLPLLYGMFEPSGRTQQQSSWTFEHEFPRNRWAVPQAPPMALKVLFSCISKFSPG